MYYNNEEVNNLVLIVDTLSCVLVKKMKKCDFNHGLSKHASYMKVNGVR